MEIEKANITNSNGRESVICWNVPSVESIYVFSEIKVDSSIPEANPELFFKPNFGKVVKRLSILGLSLFLQEIRSQIQIRHLRLNFLTTI